MGDCEKKKKKNKQKLVNILTAWVKGLPCIASTNKLYPNLCLHFSLISIFLSFSDQALKIHFLNIKRTEQLQLLIIFEKLKTLQRMYGLNWFLQLSMASISFDIACKELKLAQIAQINQAFQLLNSLLVHTVTSSMGLLVC